MPAGDTSVYEQHLSDMYGLDKNFPGSSGELLQFQDMQPFSFKGSSDESVEVQLADGTQCRIGAGLLKVALELRARLDQYQPLEGESQSQSRFRRIMQDLENEPESGEGSNVSG